MRRIGRRIAALAVAATALAAGFAGALPPSSPALAGRLAFRTFADDEGLGNLTVECLLEDRDGRLWIGTQDGLFRFDGARFTRFGRDEGLPSSRINSLHQSATGLLYAGTRTGLAVLAGERFAAVGPERGLPASAIPDQGIASDPAGALYVGTPEGLFVAKPGGRFTRVPPLAADDPPEANGLSRDPDGALIFARGGRLFRRRAGRTEEIGRPLGLPDGERIDQTATDGEGRLWARTLTRLWVLPPAGGAGERRFARHDRDLPEGVASGRLALDDRGRLLVPTAHGLAYEEGGAWRRIDRGRGLPAEATLSALVDREGSLWIGLAGGGLAQQPGRGAFASRGSAEGLSHDVVWSIVRPPAPPGSVAPLWVGTEDGLDRIDPATGEVRTLVERDGLGGNTVYALAAGADGSVWAGSWPGGVTRVGPEPGRVRRYGAPELPPGELRVSALYFDRAGNLWVGARSGAYRLAAGSTDALLTPVRLPGWDDRDSIYGFAEDRAGTVYGVGRYGLQRLTGPHPRRFRQADGLLADFLSSVVATAPGEPGDLIVGYREALGAARLWVDGDRLRIAPLNRSTGLTFDKVLFLGRDTTGALWVGGSGVDVWRRPSGPPRHFGRSAGLITEDTSQNAFFAEPGAVWLGTSRGLVRFRPDLEPPPPPPPPILLTGATAGSRRLLGGGPAVLERDQRDLAVAWTAPTFLDPSRVRFRYRLAGFEDTFHETAAREVRFPALPTGDYRLEVVAVSAAGVASVHPAVLSLAVRPAWWERPAAWIAGLVLLGLAGAGLVRLRTRHLEAERRRLEAAVAERSLALARAVEELEEASSTDFLTGVRNRRYLNLHIEADLRRAEAAAARGERGSDLLVFLIDVDHFKAVNDQHGHHTGDRLLVEMAARLQTVVRGEDLLVRWGGEEFLLLVRGADREQGPELAGRILAAVGDRPFELGEADRALSIRRTCSVGWAPFPWFPETPRALDFEPILTLADHALYLAKRSGRDRAVGALPLAGPAADDPPGWWLEPLPDAGSSRVRLLRTRRGDTERGGVVEWPGHRSREGRG